MIIVGFFSFMIVNLDVCLFESLKPHEYEAMQSDDGDLALLILGTHTCHHKLKPCSYGEQHRCLRVVLIGTRSYQRT